MFVATVHPLSLDMGKHQLNHAQWLVLLSLDLFDNIVACFKSECGGIGLYLHQFKNTSFVYV